METVSSLDGYRLTTRPFWGPMWRRNAESRDVGSHVMQRNTRLCALATRARAGIPGLYLTVGQVPQVQARP